MTDFITTVIIGVVICALGIVNMTGNISTLHSYHRNRVSEENRKPFGKLVGLGTLIVGVALIAYGALMLACEKTMIDALGVVATAELIVGIVAGLGLAVYAMKKYNNGVF